MISKITDKSHIGLRRDDTREWCQDTCVTAAML